MINITYYLDAPDEEFDIDEATEFLRDTRIELASTLEVGRSLGKLETRIKNYIKAYGVVPEVDGVEAKIISKKDQLVIRRGQLPALYAYLQGYGVSQEDLDVYFEVKKLQPAISLRIK